MKTQNNNSLPLSVKALKKVNAGLVPFYRQEIAHRDEQTDRASDNSFADHPRMDSSVDEAEMHGHIGLGKGWGSPLLVTYCEKEARPGYKTMPAHEYTDDPETLREKVKEMARLIRKSKHCLAYTGAGISTASGINDYASRSNKSRATGTGAVGKRPAKKKGLNAEPTLAHFVLGALYKAGHLKHWVQQNHDGLPQKAGFPQHALNEIHGAWFDPSNPVVPMSGSLRGDLYSWMKKEEKATDLCLTMGTSLCGMNADRMVKSPSIKYLNYGKGFGSIIIGFQRTQMDKYATLRIFSSIDEVMLLLALEMNLPVSTKPYTPDIPSSALAEGNKHIFIVPYDKEGNLSTDERITWDLRVGAKIKLTAGPGKGFEGEITKTPETEGGRSCSYTCKLPSTREGSSLGKGTHYYALGTWFLEAACNGCIPSLPFVNVP